MKKTTLGILMFILIVTSSLQSQTAAFKVSGKVTNEKTGEPIAKAMVSFQLAGEVTILIHREPAVTGPDGTYSIELPEAAYNVIVKHPEFNAYLQKDVKVASALQMDFKLAPYTPPAEVKTYVKGVVVLKGTGTPVAGAALNLLPTDGRKIYIGARSDKTGSFTFTNVPAGDYTLSASLAGYNPYSDPAVIRIGEDIKIENVRVELEKSSGYTGTIVKGIKIFVYKIDASGAKMGAEGAVVRLYGSLPELAYKGITGSNGEFVLAEAPAGFYKLICEAGGNTVFTSADLKADGQVIEVELKNPVPVEKAAVKGKVYFSADSAPIAGARVYAIAVRKVADPDAKVAVYGGVTGADGLYSFNIAPGEYYIACTYASKIPTFVPIIEYYNNALTLDKAEKITIASGAVVGGIDFSLDAPVPPPPPVLAEVTISGSLTDEAGKPVTGAKIAVYDRAMAKPAAAAVKIGADGKYTAVVSLTKGAHELIVGVYAVNHQAQFYSGKSSMYEADILKLDITGDKAELNNIDFVLKPYAQAGNYSITGRVTGADQKPLAGVMAEAFNAKGRSVMAQTDSLGVYTIAGLPEGKYIVGFSAKGYMPQYYKGAVKWENATPVVVAANVSGIDAELKKTEIIIKDPAKTDLTGGRIKGKIASGDKTPLGGARVILTDAGGIAVAADVTDSEGGFTFEAVPAGSYTLSAGKVNYRSIESEFNVSSGINAENTYYLSMNSATGVDNTESGKPSAYFLENNYPNPFNPSTRIRFSLPEAAKVRLEVYSLTGQKVAELIDENMSAGVHETSFNASGFSSGIYFYKLTTENFTAIKTMQLLK